VSLAGTATLGASLGWLGLFIRSLLKPPPTKWQEAHGFLESNLALAIAVVGALPRTQPRPD